MKFSTRHDIEAPIGAVFDAASDFARFERQVQRRGAEIRRTDRLEAPGAGAQWVAAFPYRNRLRKVQAELTEFRAEEYLALISHSGGLQANFDVEFMALARNRCRIKVGLELRPKTLPARILIQSLKFSKPTLDKKFAARVAGFGQEVENQAGAARPGDFGQPLLF